MGKVKEHFSANKDVYKGVAIGAGVVVAATAAGVVTYILMNPRQADIVQKTMVLGMNNHVNPTIVNFVERSTPSKPVHLVGTDLYFDSIHDAARKTGHNLSMISKNVNGHIDNIKGDVFELLQPA